MALGGEHPLADAPFLGGADERGFFGEFPVGIAAFTVGHDVEGKAVADGGQQNFTMPGGLVAPAGGEELAEQDGVGGGEANPGVGVVA